LDGLIDWRIVKSLLAQMIAILKEKCKQLLKEETKNRIHKYNQYLFGLTEKNKDKKIEE